eukprot:2329657-Rhodomonas_salina.2
MAGRTSTEHTIGILFSEGCGASGWCLEWFGKRRFQNSSGRLPPLSIVLLQLCTSKYTLSCSRTKLVLGWYKKRGPYNMHPALWLEKKNGACRFRGGQNGTCFGKVLKETSLKAAKRWHWRRS